MTKVQEENLAKELSHFKNRYKLDFNIISDNSLIIPEYKIVFLNKNLLFFGRNYFFNLSWHNFSIKI